MPATISACELLRTRYPATGWVVPGILAQGATILAGKAKVGKSWLGLDLSLAVASGRLALGSVQVEAGEVLYLALEDGPRRLQSRLRQLLDDGDCPNSLHFATSWPVADHGGLAALVDWLDAHPQCRLVVIDTLKRWRPADRPGESWYSRDYDALAPLADLAKERCLAILVIWHLRKLDAEDPLDLVSGSVGLTAGADGVLILRRPRGSADGQLVAVSRDAEDATLAVRWEAPRWVLQGNAADVRQSEERKAILALLQSAGRALTPREVAGILDRSHGAIKLMLWRMGEVGSVRVEDGKYSVR